MPGDAEKGCKGDGDGYAKRKPEHGDARTQCCKKMQKLSTCSVITVEIVRNQIILLLVISNRKCCEAASSRLMDRRNP